MTTEPNDSPTGSRLRANLSPDDVEARTEAVTARRAYIQALYDNAMRSGTDYGKVGNMSKPALHQPGAELLLAEFHLTAKSVRVDATEDIVGDFFSYSYLCEIWDGDVMIASREGVCNSDESHYRNAAPRRLYREMRDSGQAPEKQGRDSPNVYGAGEGAETYAQMAQKRAMVAATLVACDAHFLFTLDDDMDSVRDSASGSRGGRSCPKHPGKTFFKKGNMRGFAHPMDDGPWCDELDIIEEFKAHARAAISELIPVERGKNQAPWAHWVKSAFPNMAASDERTAEDWANIYKKADDDFQTTGAISIDVASNMPEDTPDEGDGYTDDDFDADDEQAVADYAEKILNNEV